MATERKTPAAPAKKAAAPKTATAAVAVTATVGPTGLQKRRQIVGTVVSDKMQKTIVVKVDRRVRHGLYLKYVLKSCRYKAHDETNSAKIGDLVTLIESRPLSRDKRWALQSILRRAGQVIEANV